MPTSYLAMILVVVASLFGATGGFVFKKVSDNLSLKPRNILANYKLIFGFFLFGLSGAIYIVALTQGELNVLYPISALTYVWSFFLGRFFLKEKITRNKLFGIALIILGAILITR